MISPLQQRIALVVEALPALLLVLVGFLLASVEMGSIAARDWVGHAALAALLLVVVTAAGKPVRPSRAAQLTLAGLAGLALWAALSILWTPLPSLAREEALLAAFYAVTFAVVSATLVSPAARLLVLAGVTAAATALAGVAGAELLRAGAATDIFFAGRLTHPLSYVNANAAAFALGIWPGLALAAGRALPLPVRAGSLGGVAAMLAAWIASQSKGAGVGLACSALVVFAVSRQRLRLLLPALLAAAPAAAAFSPLTAPFRAEGGEAVAAAAHRSGAALFAVAAAGVVVGALYAFADRRIELGPEPLGLVRIAVAGVSACALLAAIGLAAPRVGDPAEFVRDTWATFKRMPETEQGASHFASLGSNRYDFWRVSLGQFERDPLRGGGARSFGAAYLERGHSPETPARTHSLPLEQLGEGGVVGVALLLLVIVPPLVVVARRRARLAAVGAGAAATSWLVHASGDWLWSFPALGLPLFVLLAAASTDDRPPLLGRRGRALAIGGAAVCALVFTSAWLSERYAHRALTDGGGAAAAADLRWARRLDPVSVTPYLIEGLVAPSPAAAIPPLERAAEKEPRSVTVQYRLGLAYLRVGRRDDARDRLRRAQQLFPRDPTIQAALRELGE